MFAEEFSTLLRGAERGVQRREAQRAAQDTERPRSPRRGRGVDTGAQLRVAQRGERLRRAPCERRSPRTGGVGRARKIPNPWNSI